MTCLVHVRRLSGREAADAVLKVERVSTAQVIPLLISEVFCDREPAMMIAMSLSIWRALPALFGKGAV